MRPGSPLSSYSAFPCFTPRIIPNRAARHGGKRCAGNGWYNLLPMKMWGRFNLRKNLPQGTPCVNATLTIARPDGSQTQIATDGDWQAADAPLLRNSLYLGERFDARTSPSAWAPARVVDGPQCAVEPAGDMPKIVVYKRWKAKRVFEPKPGVFVADFGSKTSPATCA